MALYSTLPLVSNNHFRLLQILPSPQYSEITCRLVVSDLSNSTSYQALSYVWGNPATVATVLVNGQPFRITESLRRILVGLRERHFEGFVWIDQMCICQTNVNERTAQVQLMWRIYSHATRVVIWLEEEGIVSEKAIRCAELVNKLEQFPWDKLPEGHRPWMLEGTDHLPKEEWTCLQVLLANPWFYRAWTFQEIVASQAGIVLCAEFSISWDALWRACQLIKSLPLLPRGTVPVHLACYDMGCLKEALQAGGDLPANESDLGQLLQQRRVSKSSDPRDKVFSLLGMATHSSSKEVQYSPDYSKSTRTVFTETAQLLIDSGMLDIVLSSCQGSSMPGNLPTWVPDWSENLETSMMNTAGEFRASRLPQEVQIVKNPTLPDWGILEIDGTPILPITSCSDVMNDYSSDFKQHLEMMKPYYTKPYPLTGQSYDWAHFMARSPGRHKAGKEKQVMFQDPFSYQDHIELFHPKSHDFIVPVEGTQPEELYPVIRTAAEVEEGLLPHIHNHNQTGRRFVVTDYGFMGLVPGSARPGDHICLVFGCSMLHVMRPIPGLEQDAYFYIGECYIWGLMDGEAEVRLPDSGRKNKLVIV